MIITQNQASEIIKIQVLITFHKKHTGKQKFRLGYDK